MQSLSYSYTHTHTHTHAHPPPHKHTHTRTPSPHTDGSVEQHRYTGSLSKEKKAFEALIVTKETMVISLPDHSEDLLR